ncbi:hypothetical protein [Rhizobium sp. BK313]|jgi:hypothetical protein|uniref:hypothetical protein n=1 Tax=Rhizobium sp. BK313 TaxID=2587081 RepID=UPI00161CCF38|nr:hypothetical protein [Rhizobium sp. BK313]
MNTDSARFVGDVPQHYDTSLGPIIFADYASDIAERTAAFKPGRVLETAAGTGIVTRRLRDALPSGVSLTATDFNGGACLCRRLFFLQGSEDLGCVCCGEKWRTRRDSNS